MKRRHPGRFAAPSAHRLRLQAEKDERNEKRSTRGNDGGDEEMVSEVTLLERLDTLEQLQTRLGNVGEEIMAMTINEYGYECIISFMYCSEEE